MITLVTVRNPFDLGDRERQELPCLPGAPVAHYLRTAVPRAYPDTQLVVSRNGAVLPESEWRTVIPKPGDYLGVCPIVGKSENDQKTLGILAGIALTVVTMGVSNLANVGYFWGNAGMWSTLGYAAALNVGAALLSQMAKAEADTSDSASTQTWGQLQALQGQGNPVPITYGTVRTAGQILAQHVSIENDQQYLNLLFCGGEGELEFPLGIDEIKINDNLITNYGKLEETTKSDGDSGVTEKYGVGVDGNSKIEIYKRFGTNTQLAIPNFEKSYFDQYLGFELSSELNYQQWVTADTDGNGGSSLEVVLECPGGLYHINDDGELSDAWIQVRIQYRKIGDGKTVEWKEFYSADGMTLLKGKQYDSVRKVISVSLSDDEQKETYQIRCQCVDRSGSDSTRDGTTVYWTYLSQVIDKEFTRPGKALLGIKALATDQLSGSVPTITWLQTRSKVWVCVEPDTPAYEYKAADNPAWACYDLIHRAKYLKDPSTGEYRFTHRGVEAARLDYQAFAAWAEFCDQYDLKVNIIIDSVTDLWGALAKLEVAGRGKVILRGTRYSCIYDAPDQQPVQLFNMSNIIKDSFSEEFLPTLDRANAIEVSFLNKNKDYEKDVLTVYDQDEDLNQLNPTQIALDGVTDYQQAYREAYYRLKSNKYLIRVIKFDADIDAIACQVGDVILFQHDLPEWGCGGRVVNATATTITLDKKMVMESGKDYRIMFRYGNSDTMDYPGHAVAGVTAPDDGSIATVETEELTLAVPLEIVPQKFDLYAFGEVDRVAKPFRVTRISRSKDFRRSITALEYIAAVYEAGDLSEDQIIDYAVRDNAIANLKGADYRDFEGKVWLNLSWKPLTNYGGAVIRIGEAGGARLQVGKVGYDKSYFAYQVTSGKTYEIEVAAVDQFGNAMTPECLTYQVPLKSAPPEVQSLELTEDTYIKKDGTVVTNLAIAFAKSSQLQTYFEVYYSTDSGQSWKYDGYTADSAYWLKNLPNSGTVRVKVVTVDQTNTALKSGGVVADLAITGKSAPPSDVTGLTVTQKEANRAELVLAWEAVDSGLNPDLKGYEVRVGASWEKGSAIGGLVYGIATAYQVTAGGNYSFWLKAVDNSGNYSEHAATAALYVEVKPNAPASGSVIQDSYDKSNLIVSWTAVTDPDLAYYEVRMGSDWEAAAAAGVTTKETSARFAVDASGIYNLMVRSVNSAGFRSAILYLSINASVEPANVSGLVGQQSDTDRRLIRFTWTAVADQDFAYYEIRQGTLWSSATLIASKIGNPYYDYVATAEATATFLVKAVNKAGFASNDPAAATVAIALTPNRPGAGSIVSDYSNRLKLTVSWEKVSDLDIDFYEVKYGNTVIAKTGETTINYTVAVGGTHQFTVRAKNKANFYSSTLTLNTTIQAEPATVSEFTVQQSPLDRRILQFAWSAVADSDLSHYEIRKGANWDSAAVVATGLQTTTLEKMATAAETATFLIKAVTSGGAGSAAATGQTITISLKPSKPASGSITASPDNKANLIIAWEPVADTDLVNYEVRRGTNWENGVALGGTRENSFTYSAAASGSLNLMVCAKNVGGYYSNPLFLATVANLEPLDVTGFTAAQWVNDRSKVRLAWEAVAEADIDYYEIREGTNWDAGALIATRLTGLDYDVTIATERVYRFWIAAVNKSGKSSLNPALFESSFNMNPSVPSGLTVIADSSDKAVLQISWEGIADQDLQDYGLKVGLDWESGVAITWTKELKATWKPPKSKNYQFILRARNNSGFESDAIITTYDAYIEPADVTGFTAYQNGEAISLSWNKSAESDVLFYEIREGSTFDNAATLVVTGLTETNYQLKVDTETTRRYHVKAINRAGNYSQNAASMSVTVTNLPPKNVIYSYDELTLQDGTHHNTVFGPSAYNFATFGGKFSDYPETRFCDVGGLTVLKLKKRNLMRFDIEPSLDVDTTNGSVASITPYVHNGIAGYRVTMTSKGGWGAYLRWDIQGGSISELTAKYSFSVYAVALGTGIPIRSFFANAHSLNVAFEGTSEATASSLQRISFEGMAVNSDYDSSLGGTHWHLPLSVGDIFVANPQLEIGDITTVFNSYFDYGSYLCQRKDMGSVITANIGSRFVSSVLLSAGVFAKLQYRISTDGTTWTEWIDFVPAQATFRYVDFRVILAGADLTKTAEVNILTAAIDVPDVDKYGSATVAAGGTAIPFGHTYWQAPVVTPTAIGSGLRAELASVGQEQFQVRVLDSSGTDVGGSINWMARGF